MKILGFIPARAGSKGISHKNRVELGGKPLYQWVRDTAIESGAFSDIVVSTDDGWLLEFEKHSVRRKHELAQDNSQVIDAVSDYLSSCDKIYDAVAMLQPTSPFLRIQDIEICIDILNGTLDADSVHTVAEVDHHNHAANQRYFNGIYAEFCYPELRGSTNKQDKKRHYILGNLIITKTESLREYGNFYGARSLFLKIPKRYAIDIDTAEDLEYAEYLISSGISLS